MAAAGGRDPRPGRRSTVAAGRQSCQTAGRMHIERTKVVATLGPASSNREVLGGMAEAGLDVVRLNFSHGERADHLARFELVRGAAVELGRNLAVLVDLQGPKIRVGGVGENGGKHSTGASE